MHMRAHSDTVCQVRTLARRWWRRGSHTSSGRRPPQMQQVCPVYTLALKALGAGMRAFRSTRHGL